MKTCSLNDRVAMEKKRGEFQELSNDQKKMEISLKIFLLNFEIFHKFSNVAARVVLRKNLKICLRIQILLKIVLIGWSGR